MYTKSLLYSYLLSLIHFDIYEKHRFYSKTIVIVNKKLTSLVQLAMGQRQPNQNSNQQNQLRLFMSTLFYSNPLEWRVFFKGEENVKMLLENFHWKDVNASEPSPPPEFV